MKIYLDNCALGHLFDEQDQPRVRGESRAVRDILGLLEAGNVQWISSVVLEKEIARNTDGLRRLETQVLLRRATVTLQNTPELAGRISSLQRDGITGMDAEHVACAETAAVDALITTDDRLIRRYARLSAQRRATALDTIDVLNR